MRERGQQGTDWNDTALTNVRQGVRHMLHPQMAFLNARVRVRLSPSSPLRSVGFDWSLGSRGGQWSCSGGCEVLWQIFRCQIRA